MRILFTLLFVLATAQAHAANLPGRVLGYECSQIDPDKDGFTCKLKASDSGTHMLIHFTQDASKLPEKIRQYQQYRYQALLLRYFDLGGTFFSVTADYWQPGNTKDCSKSKGKRFSYHCGPAHQ